MNLGRLARVDFLDVYSTLTVALCSTMKCRFLDGSGSISGLLFPSRTSVGLDILLKIFSELVAVSQLGFNLYLVNTCLIISLERRDVWKFSR